MTKPIFRIIAWLSVAVSSLAAFLSIAPFTPAIYLTALLLPLAAFTAWKRALLPSAITVLLFVLAFLASPGTSFDLLGLTPVVAWLVLCLVAVVLGFYFGSRPRK